MSLLTVMSSSTAKTPAGMMKALTVHQPYAALIWHNLKKNETRGWATRYRGPIAIHAGMRKMRPSEFTQEMDAALIPFYLNPMVDCFEFLPFGAIIGVFELWDCVPIWKLMKESPINKFEYHCGNYSEGRYAWRLKPIKTFMKPVPFKGQQGLWHVPLSLLPEYTGS